MTSPVVAADPAMTVSAAARLMHKRHVKRLPVLDASGRLIGIVSRIDLLKTFMRSDESIRREVVDQVLARELRIDPKSVGVEVVEGLVKLSGQVATKSLVDLIAGTVARVEGTVGVDCRLAYRFGNPRGRSGGREAQPSAHTTALDLC
jgi:CBS-domain-containing membrane protein